MEESIEYGTNFLRIRGALYSRDLLSKIQIINILQNSDKTRYNIRFLFWTKTPYGNYDLIVDHTDTEASAILKMEMIAHAVDKFLNS